LAQEINLCGVVVGKTKERHHVEDFHMDGRILLKWVLKKQEGKEWDRPVWLRIGTSGGFLLRS
jgi:hypothetical protein